jgi:hypothetical protein
MLKWYYPYCSRYFSLQSGILRLTATGIFFESSTDTGDHGELAAPGKLTEVQGLGAKPVVTSGPGGTTVAVIGVGRGQGDVALRSLDSGASDMMVVTSREKNSSIV